ncbi:hypothetical protein GGI25_005016 [Coemansia spiralis]|uniref:Uncharacterized protein n=1 Tax=Coemansia spiralis TaxID=417178 RepID=A0A9W8KWH3_9FUNG|nr:hypothetical protein GGI25_005016 [Coemansia spiralis]
MTDLDLDSKAILNGLVYLDQHNQLPPNAPGSLSAQSQHHQQSSKASKNADHSAASAAVGADPLNAPVALTQQNAAMARLTATSNANMLSAMSPKSAAGHFNSAGPHAIATLKVETSAVIKELSRFRACDDQSMSCFYCREWAQWVYRKQIALQALGGAATSSGGGSNSNSGNKKKKRAQGGASSNAGNSSASGSGVGNDDASERERMERKRAARLHHRTISDLCDSLRTMVVEEKNVLMNSICGDAPTSVSRPASPSLSVTSTTSSGADTHGARGSKSKGSTKSKDVDDASASNQQPAALPSSSILIDNIVERVTQWYEGYQFPLADVYEDLTFDFPPDAFPYDDNQDPLDPALLLPALQVTKTYISLPASNFPLLGNITSELIATHTYPTCQHTKADHPTPSELETQRLIFNSQLQKWRGEYKRSFEREMEPVWQITQLLLKSAQRIETMRVRLFARGCRANREQFLQTIRSRTQPFVEYWAHVSEPYRTGKAATMTTPLDGDDGNSASEDTSPQQQQQQQSGGSKKSRSRKDKIKSPVQLAEEMDHLLFTHLDNLLEVSASWSRTFLESYYGVAREFVRELETILGECITMCDRRAQGVKYPTEVDLRPQLDKARLAISCLLPHLENRIERIQGTVRERNAEIFNGTEEVRALWIETSGSTVQTKLVKAAHKDFKKKLRRIEYQQQTGVIAWAMRELEHLLTAPDVAAVVADCLELMMTEAEFLERAVGQVFIHKLQPTTEDLREQRQDIIDDFTEGLLTGREELAGIIGKLMLKEAWRILEANISLQRQKALLDGTGSGGGSGKNKKNKASANKASGNNHPAANASSNAQNTAGNSQQQQQQGGSVPSAPTLADQYGEHKSYTNEQEMINNYIESHLAEKRKKNKKKKNKKKSKSKGASASTATRVAGDGASVADDDYDGEDDGNDEDQDTDMAMVQDPHNPFASLTWADKMEESSDADKSKPAGVSKRNPQSVAAVQISDKKPSVDSMREGVDTTSGELEEATDEQHHQRQQNELPNHDQQQETHKQHQELQKQEPQPQSRPPSQSQPRPSPASDDSSSTAKIRPRRGTNAARYVPGVGFVSDDGVNATSPQLVSNSSAGFKPSANVVTGSAGVAQSARSTLGIQPGSVRASSASISNGRMSPMSVARLASPISRSQSPLVGVASGTSATSSATGAGLGPGVAVDRKASSAAALALDKEALMSLQESLVSGSPEMVEKTLSGLAYDNLVSLTIAAISDKRRLVDVAAKWQGSVNSVLQTYDMIASQIELFKGLCEAHDSETARLSSLLAQAAQEAQNWHEQYDKLSAEVESLRIANRARDNKGDSTGHANSKNTNGAETNGGGPRRPSVEQDATIGSPLTGRSAAPASMPLESKANDTLGGTPGGMGGSQYGNGAGFGQFPGMMPHGAAGNIPASLMNHPSFAAAAAVTTAGQMPLNMDPASLLMLTGSQMGQGVSGATSQTLSPSQHQMLMQQPLAGLMNMGGLNLGMLGNATSSNSATAATSHGGISGGGSSAMTAGAASSGATSSSLLTALNAGSQPF